MILLFYNTIVLYNYSIKEINSLTLYKYDYRGRNPQWGCGGQAHEPDGLQDYCVKRK